MTDTGRLNSSFGGDLSNVRVAAPGGPNPFGAQAFATENNVAFGQGPGNTNLAAHEVAHVVQQRAGVNFNSSVHEFAGKGLDNGNIARILSGYYPNVQGQLLLKFTPEEKNKAALENHKISQSAEKRTFANNVIGGVKKKVDALVSNGTFSGEYTPTGD